jgi:hypothetical protein
MEKQTALDFLLTELDIAKLISRERLTMAAEVVRQAKEMEKQQIMDAFDECGNYQDNYSDSEHYYRSTFNREEKQR